MHLVPPPLPSHPRSAISQKSTKDTPENTRTFDGWWCVSLIPSLFLENDANSRFDRYHKWTILIAVAALIALVIFLLVRYIPPAVPPPSSRWSGPVHFTIPVLSPFTSVVSILPASPPRLMTPFCHPRSSTRRLR